MGVFNPDPSNGKHDSLCVIDTDPESSSYSQVVGRVEMPGVGDEIHHFGWNACSAALCPYAPHPHVERRYLLVPGLRSSRMHIIDTKPDPRSPKAGQGHRAGGNRGARRLQPAAYDSLRSRRHLRERARQSPKGDGPGGIFLLDHESFDVLGRWEVDRGPQYLAYDFWWHLGYDVAITSEWGTPNMIENGPDLDLLRAGQVWPSAASVGSAPAPPSEGV